MKTTEEFFATVGVPIHRDYVGRMSNAGFRCFLLSDIKERELDSYKAGMVLAAEIADKDNEWPKSKAILTAAEQLKEIPK